MRPEVPDILFRPRWPRLFIHDSLYVPRLRASTDPSLKACGER
jgi:hypothetical protein